MGNVEAAGISTTPEEINALTEEAQRMVSGETHNALRSLWGDGPKKSYHRAQDINGAAGKKKGERPQEIYTPQHIIDAVLKVWPEGIAMDPCSGPNTLIESVEKVVFNDLMPRFEHYKHGKWVRDFGGSGGLDLDWPERTYVNPPYCDLKKWLPKCADTWECIALVPSRSHRKWWRAAADKATQICDFNPIKFVGYPGTFPAPVCAMYWGGRAAEFAAAFAEFGTVYKRLPYVL